MVWAKLDDCILDNPKIARAGVIGFALHVAAITWCCRNLTDGFVPVGRVACMLDMSQYGMSQHDKGEEPALPAVDPLDVADWLVECELWHYEPGGYRLNDFLDYNPSKAKVLAERERGRASAKSSYEKRAKPTISSAEENQKTRNSSPDLRPPFGDSSAGPVPVPDPVPRETETPPSVGAASLPTEPGPTTKVRRKPETPCPGSGATAGELRDWSARWGIDLGHGEFNTFLDYHRARDTRFRDWAAAWRTWLKNASKFAQRSFTRPAEVTKQPADLSAAWMQDDYVGKNTGT